MSHRTVSRSISTVAAFVATFAAGAAGAQQSLENFSFHGSLTSAYAKSDGLPVFGINKKGTFDYNLIALQFGYKFDENDRVVVQLLHRGLGSSPLAPLMPELSPIWAFYERKTAGFAIKMGRNPLPRGIFNEVRFIGTLLPLFREATYGETLESIDGIVVSRSFDLGHNWGFDANVAGGEFDIKVAIPTATGNLVTDLRAKNSAGTQLWLRTPITGLRVGAFLNRFEFDTSMNGSNPKTPTFGRMLSVDGDFTHGFARAEWQKFTSGTGRAASDYVNWYAQGGVKVTEKLTLLTEYSTANSMLQFPAPLPELKVNLNNDIAGAINYSPSANVRYKFELHRADGYSFDTQVPTLIPPTKPPFVMTAAPRSKAVYGILSISVSF